MVASSQLHLTINSFPFILTSPLILLTTLPIHVTISKLVFFCEKYTCTPRYNNMKQCICLDILLHVYSGDFRWVKTSFVLFLDDTLYL